MTGALGLIDISQKLDDFSQLDGPNKNRYKWGEINPKNGHTNGFQWGYDLKHTRQL